MATKTVVVEAKEDEISHVLKKYLANLPLFNASKKMEDIAVSLHDALESLRQNDIHASVNEVCTILRKLMFGPDRITSFNIFPAYDQEGLNNHNQFHICKISSPVEKKKKEKK